MNKKLVMFGTLFLLGLMLIVISSPSSSAVGEAVICCEKTTSGAWCQEVTDEADCESSSRSAPTSCESTSYCKLGTCVNTLGGLCMSSVPQKVCEDTEATGGIAAGLWYNSKPDELNQCQLGCCLMGDQASFTTQTRCKQLSSDLGLETNYRTDISSEVACIASATPKLKGACVFEEEFQNTCRFVTKSECQDLENSGVSNVEFNPGFLCSAEQLGTNCGPSKQTTVLDGRDEVWFVDTCGNPANIYDADRQDESDCTSGSSTSCGYWQTIVPKILSCNVGEDNAGDAECGNCDYLQGSTGKLYDRNRDGNFASPNFGDYICADLDCGDVDGENRAHGESWCQNSAKSSDLENNPGTRYFRKVCYNGDVTTEACADYRQEKCIEDVIENPGRDDFSTAACRVNLWQECVSIASKKDCENVDRVDCTWLPGPRFDGQELVGDSRGKCVPTLSPGFDFWNPESDSTELCSLGNALCQAKFERGLPGIAGDLTSWIPDSTSSDWGCIENCHCVGLTTGGSPDDVNLGIGNDWLHGINNVCLALGDCGASVNSEGQEGYYKFGELVVYSEPAGQDDDGFGGIF